MRFFLSKAPFLLNKNIESFTFKRHKSFQNENYRKATHSLASIPLIFKLRQEI